MIIDDTCQYFTIPMHCVIRVKGVVTDWPPECKLETGKVDKPKLERFKNMLFRIDTPKPYPMRRRLKLTGFFPFTTEETPCEAWFEDLVMLGAPTPKMRRGRTNTAPYATRRKKIPEA